MNYAQYVANLNAPISLKSRSLSHSAYRAFSLITV